MLRHLEDRRTLVLSLVLFPLVPWLAIYRPSLLPWLVPLIVYASFSSGVFSHYHNHLPVFRARLLNDAYSVWLSAFYGFPILAWIPTHNQNHHHYLNGPGDVTATAEHKDSLFAAVAYPTLSSRAQFPLLLQYTRELKRRAPSRLWLLVAQTVAVFGLQGALAYSSITRHGVETGLWIYAAIGLFPALFAPWAMMFTNYVQHIGCDPASPDNHSRNFVGKWQNALVFNAGYHTVHHEHPTVHWSEYARLHEERAGRIAPHLNQQTILQFCVEHYLLGRPLQPAT